MRPSYYLCKWFVPAVVLTAGLGLVLWMDQAWYVDGLAGVLIGWLSGRAQEWAMDRERRNFWDSLDSNPS